MLFWLEKQKKGGISSIYRKKANRFPIDTKKSSAAMDMFTHISLLVSKRLCKIADNTLKWERKLCKKWQDEKSTVPFDVTGTWYVSPSLMSMDEKRQRRKKHTHIWTHKATWTSANKRWTTRTELWQLIKAHAPNIGVINYAEGSIVHSCLLLQIIERFKGMVGGGSCRLSFSSASSNTPSPLESRLCLDFGARL